MVRWTAHEVERQLAESGGSRPVPPADLLPRITAEIPDSVSLAPRLARQALRRRRTQPVWLLAASLIVGVGAALLTWRLQASSHLRGASLELRSPGSSRPAAAASQPATGSVPPPPAAADATPAPRAAAPVEPQAVKPRLQSPRAEPQGRLRGAADQPVGVPGAESSLASAAPAPAGGFAPVPEQQEAVAASPEMKAAPAAPPPPSAAASLGREAPGARGAPNTAAEPQSPPLEFAKGLRAGKDTRIVVEDVFGRRLPGAAVVISAEPEESARRRQASEAQGTLVEREARSDRTGVATFEPPLPAGRYRLRLVLPGYQEITQVVEVKVPGGELHFRLFPRPEGARQSPADTGPPPP